MIAALERAVRTLRETCNTPKPVRVRVLPLVNESGLCWLDPSADHIRITIHNSSCHQCQKDTLIHEWAHAMCGTVAHGRQWAKAFSRCYRAVYPEDAI